MLRNAPVGLALFLALAPVAARAARYEVARNHPRASDEGPGTPERPWKTLARGCRDLAPGDQVLVRGGVYRERIIIQATGTATAPITMEAAPGEHVVVTGADPLRAWVKAERPEPVYGTDWPYRFNTFSPNMTHPDDARHRLIGRCEQVFVYGYPLRQVLTANQLAPGTFFVDAENRKLWAWDAANRDLNRADVEASTRAELLAVRGAYVSVRGILFHYAANAAQHGAVLVAAPHSTIEDCAFEEMNSVGAAFLAEDVTVRRCAFRHNGQLGFSANRAHRLRFTDCVVEANNVKDFDRGWEAGGNKLVLCRDAVLERSRFLRNHGSGIWFDIGNEHCAVSHCLIADNEDAGIFYEISYGLQAHDNVIVGNGFAATAGAWGAQAGICLSSSPNCIVERNLLVGNREGFDFREQRRTTPTIKERGEHPIWNHDNTIRHNLIARNRDAQVWGWFDVADNRHWPAGRPPGPGDSRPAAKPGDLAANYQAKTAPSSDLSLEKLNLRFEQNVYFAAPGQGWFHWGTPWRQHRIHDSLVAFQAALGLDGGSRVVEPAFANPFADDFRLKPALMEWLHDSYPQGEIPGTELGVLAN